MTLMDVVEFYEHNEELNKVRFIPRDLIGNPDKNSEIVRLKMNQHDKRALVFFLMCLTDERVRSDRGPFTHPSLRIAHGYMSTGEEIDEAIPASRP